MPPSAAPARAINPSNRFGLDYPAEAARFAPPPTPGGTIIDVHSHINGPQAAKLYERAARLYRIGLTYSMTQLEQVEAMRAVFGTNAGGEDRIRFIAVPNWSGTDKRHEMSAGFLERIAKYHALGCRIAKFWAAPRSIEIAKQLGEPAFMRLDAPHRIESMQLAHDLGMIFMTHVGDPDTWFRTKYADAAVYGSKRDQYRPFEALLERFGQPWIAAHLGGWPEDLAFLTGLLERHPNLYLDTSAAKWMIREVSRQPRAALIEFLTRFRGRIMFGSDIVTTDGHLVPAKDKLEMAAKASAPDEAFDLYASRYWALRTMWETEFEGESPIADPDLAMVEPERHDQMSAPALVGKALPRELLESLYFGAAHALLEPLHAG